MKRTSSRYPPTYNEEARATIFAQKSLLLCIRRTAWWLFQHELTRTDPDTDKYYTPWRALENVLKWMAEQSEMLERVKQEPTQKQKRLLQMLADGKSQKEIAVELGVNPRSLRTHFFRMRSRLGVETLFQALAVGVRKGWVRVQRAERPEVRIRR
jgi:DNA-binding CsgD family transcriptional regulator